MAELRYRNFDLIIAQTERGYRARVRDGPGAPAEAEFRLPFSDLEIENFLLKAGQTSRRVRRIDAPEMQAAKDFGGRLFSAVFTMGVGACFQRQMDDAVAQSEGLRVRLHLTDAPQLANVPWEYLYNPALNRFLALGVETPVVRYLDLPEVVRPLLVKPPLRILVMIANPANSPAPLDVDREWAGLGQSLRGLEQNGLIALERLDGATLTDLQRRLRQQEYHIFHFIGHGGFDRQAHDGLLWLEDEDRSARTVSGQDLGMLLHNHRSLRLVILNACEGARAALDDPFAGTAQSLVQQGIPAVIAMQFAISDEAAITFAHEFYHALAVSYPVDMALTEARLAVRTRGSDLEWGTPVLYLRAPDGKIFDVQSAAPDLARHETGKTDTRGSDVLVPEVNQVAPLKTPRTLTQPATSQPLPGWVWPIAVGGGLIIVLLVLVLIRPPGPPAKETQPFSVVAIIPTATSLPPSPTRIPPTPTTSARGYVDLGESQSSQKHFDLALVNFNHAITLDPNSARAYVDRGEAYDKLGKVDLALTDYSQAIKLDPGLVVAYDDRGYDYFNQSQYSRALADFNQAIKLDPTYDDAYNGRGKVYYSQSQYGLALDDYNQAIKLDPSIAIYYSNRGKVYYNQSQYGYALDDYNQAIKLDATYDDAYNGRGNVYYNQNKRDLALADYDQAIKLAPNVAAYFANRGNVYYGRSQYGYALDDYDQAIKLDPTYAAAYYDRALVYREQNKNDEAIADFRKYLELAPSASDRSKVEQWISELQQ